MKNIKRLCSIVFIFYVLKACLLGASFDLPVGTPGIVGNVVINDAQGRNINCKHILIPNTTCHLYFPTDGSQPDTIDAGLWSGARYNNPDNNRVTDWWMRVFGGNQAVNISLGGMPDILAALSIGYGERHIISIKIKCGIPMDFKRQFWQNFRVIAADPVGRVLLYRLLIESRRVDPAGHGCCGGDVILPREYNLNARNNCRSIEIYFANDGCSFSSIKHRINFKHDNTVQTTTLIVQRGGDKLTTSLETRPSDVALFHEMLHWLHFLRNPRKQTDNKSLNPQSYRYAMRCYYGYPSELCAWGNINAEEIATILGSPNLNINPHPYTDNRGVDLINNSAFPNNDPGNSTSVQISGMPRYILNFFKFLNGDDLSENVYRASRGQHMRFGHVSSPINPVAWPNLPNRFRLAHKVAQICYQLITDVLPLNWDLVQGQAIR